jgi:hypothetical protein
MNIGIVSVNGATQIVQDLGKACTIGHHFECTLFGGA